MGLFSGISKAFKSVGNAIGGVVKGVAKFAQSPFGKLLINVGLTFLTGGAGGLVAKALGALGGSSLGGLFQGFAGKFLTQATDYLSKNGLASVAGFLDKAGSSGDLLSLAKGIASATKDGTTDATTADVVKHNLLQLFAQRAAAQLTGA